jgi:hypothetical protein
MVCSGGACSSGTGVGVPDGTAAAAGGGGAFGGGGASVIDGGVMSA